MTASSASHDGRLADGEPALRDVPAEPERTDRRPNTAPAYYLGHPARLWTTVMRTRRRHTTSHHAMQTLTDGKPSPSRQGGPLADAGAETVSVTPATTSWPVTRVQ